jgi:alpha-1,2-mannosyltransferase
MEADLHLKSARIAQQRTRLVIAIGCALTALGLALLVFRVQSIMVFFSDFTHDYVSAQAYRDGRSIYIEFTQADLSAEKLRIAEPLYRAEPFTNIHPPFDALLFAPLTLLPYNLAILVWSVLSCLLYLGIGFVVLRELEISLAPHWCLLLLGLGLCWYPFQAHIALGQLSLLVIACLIGCWVLLRRGRDGLAGVLLGLACLIKVYPGVLLFYLLCRRRWRAAGSTIATGLAGLLLTTLLVGADDVLRYFTQVTSEAAGYTAFALINISLNGVFGRLFTDGPWISPLVAAPWLSSALTLLSTFGLLVLFTVRLWRAPATRAEDDRGFALACVVMLLISPITWQHVFPVLILPFGLLLYELWRHPNRRRIGLALLALALVSLPDIDIARALMALYAPYRTSWFAALAMLGSTIGLFLLWQLIWTQKHPEVAE